MKKTENLIMRMTPDEKRALTIRAKRRGQTITEYVRRAVFTEKLHNHLEGKLLELAEYLGKDTGWVLNRILADYFARRYAWCKTTGRDDETLHQFAEADLSPLDFTIMLTELRCREMAAAQRALKSAAKDKGVPVGKGKPPQPQPQPEA